MDKFLVKLIRKSESKWIVSFHRNNTFTAEAFDSIEEASDFLMDYLKIQDGTIDTAVANIYTAKKSTALFNVADGSFIMVVGE